MVESNLQLGKMDHNVVPRTELRLRIALIVLFLGYVLATFHRFSLAILADRLLVDLHLNVTQLSALTAVYFYPYAFMQFPVGIIVDRIGPNAWYLRCCFLPLFLL